MCTLDDAAGASRDPLEEVKLRARIRSHYGRIAPPEGGLDRALARLRLESGDALVASATLRGRRPSRVLGRAALAASLFVACVLAWSFAADRRAPKADRAPSAGSGELAAEGAPADGTGETELAGAGGVDDPARIGEGIDAVGLDAESAIASAGDAAPAPSGEGTAVAKEQGPTLRRAAGTLSEPVVPAAAPGEGER